MLKTTSNVHWKVLTLGNPFAILSNKILWCNIYSIINAYFEANQNGENAEKLINIENSNFIK